jgi:hypothetical protein
MTVSGFPLNVIHWDFVGKLSQPPLRQDFDFGCQKVQHEGHNGFIINWKYRLHKDQVCELSYRCEDLYVFKENSLIEMPLDDFKKILNKSFWRFYEEYNRRLAGVGIPKMGIFFNPPLSGIQTLYQSLIE